MEYLRRIGRGVFIPTRQKLVEIFWSWIGAFLGISAVAYIHYRIVDGTDAVMLIGSFGASAVLIYGAIDSPLAQPKNLVGGHILSAIVGVTAYQFFPDLPWVAAPLAVATAISLMQFTGTLHPPGGATALIAVIGGENIHHLGYTYVFLPVATGALVMLAIALFVNKASPGRTYPATAASKDANSSTKSRSMVFW